MAFRWGSKTEKWQIEAKITWHQFEGKSIGLDQKKKKKAQSAHNLENQDAS
jgi:hypothetical protein